MIYTDPEDDRFVAWGCAAVLIAFAVISLAIVVVASLARGGRL